MDPRPTVLDRIKLGLSFIIAAASIAGLVLGWLGLLISAVMIRSVELVVCVIATITVAAAGVAFICTSTDRQALDPKPAGSSAGEDAVIPAS